MAGGMQTDVSFFFFFSRQISASIEVEKERRNRVECGEINRPPARMLTERGDFLGGRRKRRAQSEGERRNKNRQKKERFSFLQNFRPEEAEQ